MRYIQYGERGWELDPYLQYIREQEGRFPPGAREFASQTWHCDIKHRQCPHDSWLEALTVREISSGDRKQIRRVEITARFLGAYHDGYFELTYDTVTSYSLGYAMPTSGENRGHGDWIVDEITLNEASAVRHEIQFDGGNWVICCADLHYRWLPTDR